MAWRAIITLTGLKKIPENNLCNSLHETPHQQWLSNNSVLRFSFCAFPRWRAAHSAPCHANSMETTMKRGWDYSLASLLCCFPELLACVLRGFKRLGRDEAAIWLSPERAVTHADVVWCSCWWPKITTSVIWWCKMVKHWLNVLIG